MHPTIKRIVQKKAAPTPITEEWTHINEQIDNIEDVIDVIELGISAMDRNFKEANIKNGKYGFTKWLDFHEAMSAKMASWAAFVPDPTAPPVPAFQYFLLYSVCVFNLTSLIVSVFC